MAVLWERMVFSVRGNSWKVVGSRTFLGSAVRLVDVSLVWCAI